MKLFMNQAIESGVTFAKICGGVPVAHEGDLRIVLETEGLLGELEQLGKICVAVDFATTCS